MGWGIESVEQRALRGKRGGRGQFVGGLVRPQSATSCVAMKAKLSTLAR